MAKEQRDILSIVDIEGDIQAAIAYGIAEHGAETAGENLRERVFHSCMTLAQKAGFGDDGVTVIDVYQDAELSGMIAAVGPRIRSQYEGIEGGANGRQDALKAGKTADGTALMDGTCGLIRSERQVRNHVSACRGFSRRAGTDETFRESVASFLSGAITSGGLKAANTKAEKAEKDAAKAKVASVSADDPSVTAAPEPMPEKMTADDAKARADEAIDLLREVVGVDDACAYLLAKVETMERQKAERKAQKAEKAEKAKVGVVTN